MADKTAEILALAPTLAGSYVLGLISPTQDGYTRISSKINELPALETSEAGQLKEKLNNVGIHIRELQQFVDGAGTQGIEAKAKAVASKFRILSREYAGIESKLAELLNNKILSGFDVS